MCLFTLLYLVGVQTLITVNISVLLPETTPNRHFSTAVVRPAIAIAVSRVHQRDLLPNVQLHVTYIDTPCSPNIPIPLLINFGGRNLLLGPVCDYALAPIARQTQYYNIPIITTGGFSDTFINQRNISYPFLTRVSPASFADVSNALLNYLIYMNWNRAFLLVEESDEGIFKGYWHILGDAIDNKFQSFSRQYGKNFVFNYSLVSMDSDSLKKTLRKTISTKFSSKSYI